MRCPVWYLAACKMYRHFERRICYATNDLCDSILNTSNASVGSGDAATLQSSHISQQVSVLYTKCRPPNYGYCQLSQTTHLWWLADAEIFTADFSLRPWWGGIAVYIHKWIPFTCTLWLKHPTYQTATWPQIQAQEYYMWAPLQMTCWSSPCSLNWIVFWGAYSIMHQVPHARRWLQH